MPSIALSDDDISRLRSALESYRYDQLRKTQLTGDREYLAGIVWAEEFQQRLTKEGICPALMGGPTTQ